MWAKTGMDKGWHALPFHLLDVAAAAEAVWDRLPSGSRPPAPAALGDGTNARAVCAFLAAAHDVGKANRYFQAKVRSQYDRLKLLHGELPAFTPDDHPRHGQATGAHLKPWLIEHWRWSDLTAETVALAVGGHHGSFFDDTRRTRLGVDGEPWCGIGRALLDAVSEELLAGVEPPAEPMPLNPFLGWLAGFVSVADWLGSHESMTVWQTGERPLTHYLHEARTRANQLLDSLRWNAPTAAPNVPLADLVPAGSKPNALQRLAAETAWDFSLAIVEAPTGEGKTEAAFALVEPARSAGAGVYFALPTMATANGLHGRVEAYLRNATRDQDLNARLLHSQAWLFREDARTAQDPEPEGSEQEIQAQDWFAGAKRGLLAPYGVGTIDQALVAALRARHGFVRLFALAGKTVVIDEVHAYDVYMGDLLGVLLGWLRALRCRVVLLSATLPAARRRALLAAWGAHGDQPRAEYPCISWVRDDRTTDARPFDVEARKPLAFELVQATGNEEPWEQGAARILKAVASKGGLGALILNTVRDAQKAWDWLRTQGADGVDLELFHARFTAQDRDKIERRVLERFGKAGGRTKPAVLVATQVVEQSLDLDFDHMVTALAPVDLLIQRAGRLHRHRRRANGRLRQDGPDERPDPVVQVVTPPLGGDGLLDLRKPVYSPPVLMRTLQWLRACPVIARPSDVSDGIEAVYGERNRAADTSEWSERLAELEAVTLDKELRDKLKAQDAVLPRADDPDKMIVETALHLDESDERHGSQLAARTRLEDRPSITVAVLRAEAGRLETLHGAGPSDPRGAMFAAVRITPPYPLWEALLAIEPLPAWRRRGALSQVRPLVLASGCTRVADYEIWYDGRRGLDWRRTDAVIQA